MSVLIKGMKMPSSCHECVAGFGMSCFVCPPEEDGECPDKGRPSWCPLIELPPHGRLIDADALRLLYDFNGYEPTGDMTEEEFDRLMCRLPVIRQNIDDMPTIIEAEE